MGATADRDVDLIAVAVALTATGCTEEVDAATMVVCGFPVDVAFNGVSPVALLCLLFAPPVLPSLVFAFSSGTAAMVFFLALSSLVTALLSLELAALASLPVVPLSKET